MNFSHSNVYIIRVVDELVFDRHTWFVGPYGSTRADQVADDLQAQTLIDIKRTCIVEPLFSNDGCLRVTDYGRAEHGSLT